MTLRNLQQRVTDWLPFVAGAALIVLFVNLASWQLDRAAEKRALSDRFGAEEGTAAVPLTPGAEPPLYQLVSLDGRYLADRQVLIDNVISNSRVGYYVVTPFETEDGRVLLVNRGWVEKPAGSTAPPPVPVAEAPRRIVARAGRLPRVALRTEAAFADGGDWPRVAVFPTFADVEAALGRPLAEPVLLLAPGEPDGYLRDWRPVQKGPSMHYGYAFQWSALALTVLIVMIIFWRKRRHHERTSQD